MSSLTCVGRIRQAIAPFKAHLGYGRGQEWLAVHVKSNAEGRAVIRKMRETFETWRLHRRYTYPPFGSREGFTNNHVTYIFIIRSKSGKFLGTANIEPSPAWTKPGFNVIIDYGRLELEEELDRMHEDNRNYMQHEGPLLPGESREVVSYKKLR